MNVFIQHNKYWKQKKKIFRDPLEKIKEIPIGQFKSKVNIIYR